MILILVVVCVEMKSEDEPVSKGGMTLKQAAENYSCSMEQLMVRQRLNLDNARCILNINRH